MAIPDYQTLMLPLLRASTDGEKRIADVADRIADEVGLTSEERMALLPSGRQRLLQTAFTGPSFICRRRGSSHRPLAEGS